MDGNKNLPTLIGKLKIDWLDFPVDDILQFATLKDGTLRGVFKQQAARGGVAVAPRRPRQRFFFQGSVASASGLRWLTVCLTVGPKASILVECK